MNISKQIATGPAQKINGLKLKLNFPTPTGAGEKAVEKASMESTRQQVPEPAAFPSQSARVGSDVKAEPANEITKVLTRG